MKPFFLLLALFFQSSLISQNQALNNIEAPLQAILEATKAPSFAVAVVKGDEVIYSDAFGYRDYENKIEADANTLYAIGSCSKAFTSAILGQLRHEGELSFEDNPMEYIPELKFYNDELTTQVTINDMMCHRTGLPRHDFAWYLFPTNDKDSLITKIQYQEPFTGVRESWYYNNFMFLVQGVIAEKITGKSWEDNIRERFFKTLDMNRSNVTIQEMKDAFNAAYGYELEDDDSISKMDYYDIAAMNPAGSINSSVNDMTKWIKIWLNGGKMDSTQIIPKSYITEAISSQMVVSGALPDAEFPDIFMANYGYAWFMNSYKGHYRVQHGGNIDGFSANVALYPSDSIGIIVLTNQNGSSVPSLVRNTIADRLLGVDQTDWAQDYLDDIAKSEEASEESNEAKETGKVENTRPSHSAVEYTGDYNHPGYGTFNIRINNDSLFADFKLRTVYLKHYHYDIYEPFEVDGNKIDTTALLGLKMNFTANNTGDIASVDMKIEPTLDPIKFKRTPSAIEISAEDLDQLVGTFELVGMVVKTYTKDTNVLYLFVTGQPEYELIAIEKDKFAFKSLDGFKVGFNRVDNDTVESITLYQPNGVFTAKKQEE